MMPVKLILFSIAYSRIIIRVVFIIHTAQTVQYFLWSDRSVEPKYKYRSCIKYLNILLLKSIRRYIYLYEHF